MSWMSVSPHTWRLACVRDMVRPVVLRHVGGPRPERAGGVRPEDVSTLDQNAAWLKANPGTLLLIEGHTDERGTSEYNLGLGDLRASAAKRYMMDQGVASARMVAISYGKERPLCTEHTESCWARNRRAHFLAKPR